MDTKVFREIKQQKFRSLLIVGIVSVSMALLISMRAGYPMMMASYRENLREQSVADGRFTFSSPILESNVSAITEDTEFMESESIDKVEGRVIYQTNLEYDESTFPAIIIGIEFPNTVNELNIEQTSDDVAANEDFLEDENHCIMETRFAGSLLGQDMDVGENISVNFNEQSRDFTVKAIGQDTDFLYVVDPQSQMALMGQMAVVWIDLDVMQNILFGGAPLINQILFTVDKRLNEDITLDAADSLTTHLADTGIDVSSMQFTLFDETADRQMFDADAGSVDKLGTIFGIIGLIVCAVAIYNTLSRIVQAQRRNIGLFMSMGAKRGKILAHYGKITLLLAGVGVAIGWPLGYAMSVGLTKMVVRVYSVPHLALPIIWGEYIVGTVVTLAICGVFSIISALPVTNITPRAAMSAFFNRIKVTKPGISEKLFGWIPAFRNIHMKVALREIFLRKKKSTVTILAITTSMIILINSVAMVANMYTGLNDNFDKYNKADVEVKLETPVPINLVENYMNNRDGGEIQHFEKYISIYTKLSVNGDFKSWMELKCYQENSTLRNINVVEGKVQSKSETTSDILLLGNGIAGKNDISVNDHITIGTLANFSVEVGGLVGELVDFSALWTLENFYTLNTTEYFGVPDQYVNGILLDVEDGTDLTDLRVELSETFSIAQWNDAEQSQQAIMNLMQTMMGVLVLFILVGMAIGILFSFSTMYMGFVSREKEFLAFKAMGTEMSYMKKMIFRENALLSVFSLIVTIPIGYLFYWWSMDYMIGDRFFMPISIPWYTWPMVFLLNLGAIWLATRKVTKKIEKMVLADELRQRAVS